MATIAPSPPSKPRLTAEQLFDSVGPAYEHAFSTCTPQRESLAWLLSQLAPSSKVLDIGCGTGRPVCSDLAAAGHSVHGIDVSGAMIDSATKNVPRAKFTKIDIKDFAAEVDSYDAITVYFSMIASVTPADIKEHIARIYGWLRSGGCFVFATVPIAGEDMEIEWMGRRIVASSLAEEEVVSTIEGVGFEVVDVRSSKFLPRAVEAGICREEEVWEEEHVFVYAKKAR